ncbi:DNA (cytosine-5-)-methyltransferase [Mycoplasmopsis columbina]|uniref:DNA (cytosine-5-)-methyltransferase n=1 Tax=Mycoplasmopsis columbina TaxID=114881 RepID=UPI001F287D02|nr:DNA (cytosine-5-)-methyltransferase [Mycoplasmopsis columbina]
MTYSFPCQDLSQQGKQKGITKHTRSGLLYEIERILNVNLDRLPKVLILENVKALANNKFINDFQSWIETLNKLGYKSAWKIINSRNYGSSQNRERVFMVSILGDKTFEFPQQNKTDKKLTEIINLNYEHKDLNYLLKKYSFKPFYETKNGIKKSKLENYSSFNSEAYIYKIDGYGPTLTASGANSRLKFFHNNNLFAMNAIESYLYMGFDLNDAKIVKESKLITESKMIFTAGNSISVEVLEAIFEKLIREYI